MYDSSNRNTAPLEGKLAKAGAVMDDMEVLERAMALVKENAPAHRELISRLAAAAQTMAGIQPICGVDEQFMAYADRPEAIARTVLEELHYNR
jgi:hypothetical protein